MDDSFGGKKSRTSPEKGPKLKHHPLTGSHKKGWKTIRKLLIKKDTLGTEFEEISIQRIYLVIIGIMVIFLAVFMLWFSLAPADFGCTKMTSEEITSAKSADPNFRYTQPINNAIYFWTTTTSTVGYGDINPKSTPAKICVGVYQLFLTFVSMGIVSYITRIGILKYEEKIRKNKLDRVVDNLQRE